MDSPPRNAITPSTARAITSAPADEIAATSESVIEADKALHQANNELEMLESALRSFSTTKATYDELSKKVRKRMQFLAAKL